MVTLLFSGLVAGGLASNPPGSVVVTVNAKRVTLPPGEATVAVALRAARVTLTDGVLYSAGSGRALDPHADPARIERNGLPVSRRDPLQPGDRLTVANGQDRVEEVSERVVPLPANGLPDVEHTLWVTKSGSLVERTGSRSGELVQRVVVTEPTNATPETRRVVALTFDDGPDPKWTPAVLEVLRDEGVTASFCMIGSYARRHAELVKAVADAGHTLCTHTHRHVVNLGRRSPEAIAAEIREGAASIADAVGRHPAFYRAPGGTLTPGVIEEVHRQGMRVLGWSVDPHDWRRPGSAAILERVASRITPGAIVLLHDGGGDRSQTVDQLRELIRRLRAQGFEFAVPGTDKPAQ